MSAHAMVQEYLNLTEQLYGIVTNGRLLRLLRDSSRLVKLTYLEFDLDRIFTDGLFADFAVLYRLLHVTRLPASQEAAADSLIERYHQDSLDSGARIRDGLSKAVEQAIRTLPTAFWSTSGQRGTAAEISCRTDSSRTVYYQHLLRLIYRLLFLMVIEERNLVFPLSPTPPSARSTTATTACSACAAFRKSATWPTGASTTSGWPCWPPSACLRPAAPAASSASPRWPATCSAPTPSALWPLHPRQRCTPRLPALA